MIYNCSTTAGRLSKLTLLVGVIPFVAGCSGLKPDFSIKSIPSRMLATLQTNGKASL
ncbi:hypothetical protein T02_8815 [Trichinella nativa]|uniref:Uncharacterized protein n=1 Tax=Trichinella nativa TaxID=6335 RepID=A0A0V1LFF7_9BILA|nr:hypothetical protein T02_8815 [Trichinella nativa]